LSAFSAQKAMKAALPPPPQKVLLGWRRQGGKKNRKLEKYIDDFKSSE